MAVIAFAISGTADSNKRRGSDHAQSVVKRDDGNFDVTCIDGAFEVRTEAEVSEGEICIHIRDIEGVWKTVDPNKEFCDMEINFTRNHGSILKLRGGFTCKETQGFTEQCTGMICSLRLDNKFYSLDFTVDRKLTLTRLMDGRSQEYKGYSGGVGNTLRLQTIGSVTNVLQASNDEGTTWAAVCDDGFTDKAAIVACRELGFTKVKSFTNAVWAESNNTFGLDQLDCKGTEDSLFDCGHLPWGNEDCGNPEHVVLECER